MKTLELSGDDWGIHVTRLRKRHGYTMRELAEEAGLHVGTILRLEQSKAAKKGTLEAVARALGCDSVVIPVPVLTSGSQPDSDQQGIPCPAGRTQPTN